MTKLVKFHAGREFESACVNVSISSAKYGAVVDTGLSFENEVNFIGNLEPIGISVKGRRDVEEFKCTLRVRTDCNYHAELPERNWMVMSVGLCQESPLVRAVPSRESEKSMPCEQDVRMTKKGL